MTGLSCEPWIRRATVGLRSQLKRLLSPLCPLSTSSLRRFLLFCSTLVLKCLPHEVDCSRPAHPLLKALPQDDSTNSLWYNPAWPAPGGLIKFKIFRIRALVLTFSLVTSTSSSVHGAPGWPGCNGAASIRGRREPRRKTQS